MADEEKKQSFPPQHQEGHPGKSGEMEPKPKTDDPGYRASGRLTGRMALITGGDSGIGRAVAILFAKEGADVTIVYLNEHEDARSTSGEVEKHGRLCLTIQGDIGDESFCRDAVQKAAERFGRLDILVNNAAVQYVHQGLEEINSDDWDRTFRTNIYGMFYMTKAALKYMGSGGSIINTTSVVAYQCHPLLIDYGATKGAIVGFTRSLSLSLASKGIRVNGVAPGPIWTPLIPSSFSEEQVATFGLNTPMGRAGEPVDVAPCYLFLASEDSSYMSGQVLHPNGGRIVNG
jgi:NAD(P)-dependent dehydrogenase (short-subunit alcohol dehydrogenase family)